MSAAAAGIGSGILPGGHIKDTSPFRLLQDYASDYSFEDDDKPCLEDVSPLKASTSNAAGATSLQGDIGSDSQTDTVSRSLPSSEMGLGMFSVSIVACSQSMPLNAVEFLPESQKTARETNITSIATVTTVESCENKYGNQEFIDNAASLEALQQKDVLDGVHDSASESGKSQSQKKDVKYTTSLPKVDEFGRLVREDASDSDADELRYTRRRDKRRRSWSRSRSPHDRRSRPQRRKERRSRSRSWSPKKRSRSRSPAYRRGREAGSDKTRRDQVQLPQCFDFLRGRCHRGASCRYIHHDSDKSDVSRRYRIKQHYVDIPHVSRTYDLYDEIEKTKRSDHEQDMPGTSFGALKDGNGDGGKVSVSVQDAMQSVISDQDDKSSVVELAKSERSGELTTTVQETQHIKEEMLESASNFPDNENCLKEVETVQLVDGCPHRPSADVVAPTGGTSLHIASAVENFVIPQSQTNVSVAVHPSADHQPQHVGGSSTSCSSQVQTSTTFQNQLPVSEPQLNKISSVQSYPGTSSTIQSFSSQSLPPMEFTPPTILVVDFPKHHSQLPPPLPSHSHGTSTPLAPQLPRGHELTQSTSKVLSLSPSKENCPPYQGPLQNQNSHFVVPPNSSWSLPPPPPPPPLPPRPPFVNYSTVNAATAMQSVPSIQFHQNQLAPINDFTPQTFIRPYPPELPAHSQVGEFQHRSYPLMHEQDPRRRSSCMDVPLPVTNPMSHSFGGTTRVGEDHFSQFPVQGLNPPNSYAKGSIPSQPVPSPRDSTRRIMQSFPGDNLPSGGFFTSLSQDYPYSQQQQPLYGLQRPTTDSLSVNVGDYGNTNSNISRYTSDLPDKNQPSHPFDFGRSRVSNHCNPYASTFDQPLSSKFSNVIEKEQGMPYRDLYDASYSLSQVPVDGHGVGSFGSRLVTFSPKPSQAADLPRSGNDQYDPLFDSIEPFLNTFKKFDHGIKHEPTNDSMLRLPLDTEENKQKDGVVTVTTSLKSENDEYGETADAEVGDVENESASNPLNAIDTKAGEVEIDQVETPGKSKKSKDSRSMKHFKVALADFVKDELKPFWRQGNMSKEAFKTIVKKTVDKVSGAMKSHQIPKSQAKINRYIDSSQRKLNKLVMFVACFIVDNMVYGAFSSCIYFFHMKLELLCEELVVESLGRVDGSVYEYKRILCLIL
ncbi:histone-lysine N-methyltransferase [Actinidia rufa]|uniref:Histone-lysine N-methyltransferase n=1 Tax=Actinidia rufa TaxID=165716 RepID=A0A7J0DSC0_9ERIC|nr:histone-lysine N-methyltransferase [Actinidia rufa]